jgi:hypothetical protein
MPDSGPDASFAEADGRLPLLILPAKEKQSCFLSWFAAVTIQGYDAARWTVDLATMEGKCFFGRR